MNIEFCCVGILWRLLSISLRVEFSGLQLSQDPQMIGLVRSRKIHLRFVGDSLEIHQRCIGDSWRHDKPTARGNSLLSAKELRHLKTWPRKRPGLLLESLVLEILEALLRFSGLFSLVFSFFFVINNRFGGKIVTSNRVDDNESGRRQQAWEWFFEILCDASFSGDLYGARLTAQIIHHELVPLIIQVNSPQSSKKIERKRGEIPVQESIASL